MQEVLQTTDVERLVARFQAHTTTIGVSPLECGQTIARKRMRPEPRSVP
jgi:hypothetical protein